MTWEPPGAGVWWFTREHFPVPVSRLFASLFPLTVIGWQRAAARYGWPIESTTFASVNGWLYYSPGTTDWDASLALEPVAERTIATQSWRAEIDRWYDEERPLVLERNLALQAEDLGALGDAELAGHIDRAITHFAAVAPLHFEHTGFDIAIGLLLRATAEWGIDDAEVIGLLAGSSPATSAISTHLDQIVRGLKSAPTSLDGVRAHNPAAFDALWREHAWRVIDGNDLAGPTLGERPGLVVAAIRSRMEAGPRQVEPDMNAVRTRVPAAETERFTELVADARGLYSLRDDDNGLCFVWPLGLIRRGVLEAGRRLVGRAALREADDLFDATPDEIGALLQGDGPRGELEPPVQLGDMPEGEERPLPPHMAELSAIRQVYFSASGGRSAGAMHGLGIGNGAVTGPARCLVDDDAIDRIEPGDVLIAVTTTCNLNSVFPLLAGVATEEGGLFSHTALLARELGIPGVVGAPGLLSAISDGDLVEIDAAEGIVRVIERP